MNADLAIWVEQSSQGYILLFRAQKTQIGCRVLIHSTRYNWKSRFHKPNKKSNANGIS
jgi:hypothetical protein